MEWVDAEYALKFFGLESMDELEDLCDDQDLLVEMGAEGGLRSVAANELPKVLFEVHRRKVGKFPDDPHHVAEARRQHQEKADRELRWAESQRHELKAKVARKKKDKTHPETTA
jgi:hypothetical protein